MKKLSLDSNELIALNTLIACHGRHLARNAYVDNCKRIGRPSEPWALRYLELYVRYSKETRDNFIDVKAARRALTESERGCDCKNGCIECQGPDLEDFR